MLILINGGGFLKCHPLYFNTFDPIILRNKEELLQAFHMYKHQVNTNQSYGNALYCLIFLAPYMMGNHKMNH